MLKSVRFSLRLSLVGILLCVFMVFLAGIAALYVIRSPQSIHQTASRVIREVSLGVNTKAESLFKPVDRQLQFTKSLVTGGYFSQHAMTDDFWVDYSFRVLKNLPSVKMVYFYLPNGHFIISRYKYDDDSEISTELVTSPTGPDNSVTYVRDWHGVLHKQKSKTTSFDARSRPWFKAAMASKKAVWSAPYVFQTGRELGITRSMPVVMKTGTLVMGVDFTLQSLSTFVTKLSKLRHRIVMLLNRDGDVLAYPGMENIITWPSNNKIPIQMIGNAWVQGAFRQYKQSPEQLIEGSEDGIGYVANFSSIPGFDHKDWLVGTVATVSSLIGDHRERVIEAVFWVLGMMLACMLILWLVANRFSRRIMSLENEMQRLSVMDFSSTKRAESHIKEIGAIERALQTMRNGLSAFEKYVPDKLVRTLLHSKEGIKRGGVKQDLVVFFSDIVNFTEFSEVLKPTELLDHMCDYFQLVTDLIWEYNGTIDKFIGDAVMAFWGAPTSDERKVFHACKASLMIQKILTHHAVAWEAAGKPALPTRIGLHRGEVVVGNVGSTDRFNYTAVGDSVNLASRLESIARNYSAFIVVSETIHAVAKDEFILMPLDVITVKGQTQSVKIYELLGCVGDDLGFAVSQYNVQFDAAFSQYQAGRFAQALELFEEMRSQYDRAVLDVYVSRCRTLLESPLRNWDGVWRFKSK